MLIPIATIAGHLSALLAGGLVLAWSAAANAADYEDGQTVNCLNTTRCSLTIPAPPQGKVNKIDYVTCIIRTDADFITLVQANNGVHGFFLLAHIATLRTHVAEGPVRWRAAGPLVVEVLLAIRTDVQFACTVAGTVAAAANAADYEDGQLVNCPNTTRCSLTIAAPPQGKVNRIDYVTCLIRPRTDVLVQANNGVHGFFLNRGTDWRVRWLAGGPLVVEVLLSFSANVQFACTVAGTVQ